MTIHVMTRASRICNAYCKQSTCMQLLSCHNKPMTDQLPIKKTLQAIYLVLKLLQISQLQPDNDYVTKQHKLTAVVLVLLGVLFITFLPYALVYQILGFCNLFNISVPSWVLMIAIIFYPISILNVVVNPLIYAWWLPQYRKSLKYLCTCRKVDNNLPNNANLAWNLTILF